MRPVIAACLVVLLGAATTAEAAGLRCGNDRVQVGESIITVEAQCGQPKRRAGLVNDDGNVIGTIYYYDSPNYGGNDRRIVFRGGRVVSIERVR